MSRPDDDREAPEQALADAFARHVERWALATGAADSATRAAASAARAVSLALSEGHVCVRLQSLATHAAQRDAPADAAAWRSALLASGVVAGVDAPGALPLVLDDEGRLYLHRYFDYERRLAWRLLQAARQTPAIDAATRARLQQRLAALFADDGSAPGRTVDWQQIAAALALRGRLTVISGGPGTGKTTTVVKLLACLIEENADCRIALAAPTGKAAARMTEAIRQRAAQLPEALRCRLPAEASTIHRLLGVTPAAGGFVHHAGNPLAIDALVIDEASMLDLALATRLLEAVPENARIVLLGDKDQLAAVESGAVFAELSADPTLSGACRDDLAALCGTPAEHIAAPPPRQASALGDTTVWFTRNFRFTSDSRIGRLAAAVNAGAADEAVAALRGAEGDAGVRWLDDASPALSATLLECIAEGCAPFIAALQNDAHDVAAAHAAFARFRVLCAVREGPRGVAAVNAEMTHRVRQRLGALDREPRSPWYPGRPVLVLRNDPLLRLFNGDVGIALPTAEGALMVFFPQPDGGFRAIAPLRLPAHETAFALTVHKAQGSEFDDVLVMLPAHGSRVLTRELLYTAVTRARRSVTLCAGAAVLKATIETATRRHSGLLARLAEGR